MNVTPIDFFKEISKIPRGSGNEAAIAEYIEKLALDQGLFCVRDKENNVFVRKPAHRDFEGAPSVLFAAHTDMVCEKLPSSQHDFHTDPLEIIEKDGFIFANETTLGADDGAGCALMLSLMCDIELKAPETEYLFTSSEETGMIGADKFDYSYVHSDMVINLDSEEEFNACIGCASGAEYELSFPVDRTRKCKKAAKITVSGLAGGHSGVDIDKGRHSATKLLGLLLDRLYSVYPFHIASLTGGSRDNVIPTNAEATLCFYDENDEKNAKSLVTDFAKGIRSVLSKEDAAKFRITFSKLKESEYSALSDVLTLKSTSAVITALLLAPQGIQEMIPSTDLVESSVNLGIAKTEDSRFACKFLVRAGSAITSDAISQSIKRLAHALGGNVALISSYPGWSYKRGSTLQSVYGKICKEAFGVTPEYTAVHAGLECGLFYQRLASLGKTPDIISVGPNLFDIHSPKEKMEIASLDRLYKVLLLMLGNLS